MHARAREMSANSESQMWLYLADHAAEVLAMERITEKLNAGVPDVTWGHGPTDRAGWLELKVVPGVFQPGVTRIPWKSPAQPLWLYRWARRGGRAGILLRDGANTWWYWHAAGVVAWHHAMLTPATPAPTFRSAGGLDVAGLVAVMTA